MPRPLAASSPSCSARNPRTSTSTAGTSRAIASRDRTNVLPSPPVERPGQPHRRPLGVVDLGPGHQVVRDRGEHGAHTDADEHEAVRGQAAAVGHEVDHRRRDERTEQRAAGDRSPRRHCSTTITNTALAEAPALMPMMSGLASGLRARLWKIAPDSPSAPPTSSAGQGARQAERLHDVRHPIGAVPEDRRGGPDAAAPESRRR